MTRRANRLIARAARRDQRREGGTITYRHISRLSGPDPAMNPPRVAGLVVDGNPYSYDPAAARNIGPNPLFAGAVVGTSTLPDGWVFTLPGSFTQTVQAIGEDAGGPFIDILIAGSTTGFFDFRLKWQTSAVAAVPVVVGQTVYADIEAHMVSGGGTKNGNLYITENAGSSTIVSTTIDVVPGRKTASRTIVGAGTTSVDFEWRRTENNANWNIVWRFRALVFNTGAGYLRDSKSVAEIFARERGVFTLGLVTPSQIGVRGATLAGRFVAGDVLSILDNICMVQSDAIATGNAATVPLTAALGGVLLDGDPITPTWLNERTVPAAIQGLGQRIPDGTLVEQRDLFLDIAAGNLPWEPTSGDTVVLPSGDIRTVVSLTPLMEDGIAVRYRIQVR